MKSWQMKKTEHCLEQVPVYDKRMNTARMRARITQNTNPACRWCQHCHPQNWLFLSGCPNWTPKNKT